MIYEVRIWEGVEPAEITPCLAYRDALKLLLTTGGTVSEYPDTGRQKRELLASAWMDNIPVGSITRVS